MAKDSKLVAARSAGFEALHGFGLAEDLMNTARQDEEERSEGHERPSLRPALKRVVKKLSHDVETMEAGLAEQLFEFDFGELNSYEVVAALRAIVACWEAGAEARS